MGAYDRNQIITRAAVDTTIGACGLSALLFVGSADATTFTILDGTAIKYVAVVATTATKEIIFSYPVAFSNLVLDLTGTASFTAVYSPRP